MKFRVLVVLLFSGIGSDVAAGAAPRRAQSGTAAVGASTTDFDPDSLRRAVQDSTRAFLLTWRRAWFAGWREDEYQTSELRKAYAHCHEKTTPLDEYASMVRNNYVVIQSTHSAAAFCPSWSLAHTSAAVVAEESDSIDAAIAPSRRAAVSHARDRLLAQLATAQNALPNDIWILGQRIRFLTDQHKLDEALTVARSCNADAWWCASLAGFVLQKQQKYVAADSAFTKGTAALHDEERCSWIDVASVLPLDAMAPYITASCAERERMAETYWWLADPLLSVPGNERRVEHFARRVTVLLHSALEQDEKFHWQPAFGGDAAEQLITRYGWPSRSVWIGGSEDVDHDRYMTAYQSLSSAPYSTNEYQPGRVHFGAAGRAIGDPFNADATAWELNAPPNMRTGIRGRGDYWWPVEHMQFKGGSITQLPLGQTAFFRRQHDVQLATAVDTDKNSAPDLESFLGRETTSRLIVATGADSMQVIERNAAPLGNRLVLSGAILSRPALLAIESSVDVPRGAFARTRFGITPPWPLDSLRAGTLAISEPVFFTPLADGSLPGDVAEMLPHMIGNQATQRGVKLGMYWENYGVSADDSIHYSVRAMLISRRSFLSRLTSALKLSDGGVSNVAVSWSDPRSRSQDMTDSNAVSILPRSIVLDLSGLSKGTYSIEVTVTARGREPARSGRVLLIK